MDSKRKLHPRKRTLAILGFHRQDDRRVSGDLRSIGAVAFEGRYGLAVTGADLFIRALIGAVDRTQFLAK